ncbi:MAG: phosphoribosylamine--glycine ligase [Planctomycetes bacterium]|nr:phosphoribosylamine--glycine ligase [Planctomycetota bacterium]MBZ0152461.1 phosphoribosylamine--glycine ligase [Planctomycetota bacterium]MCC7399283.1 phosphoribosylamine--glycine ligase [Planctomycetota bacterium]
MKVLVVGHGGREHALAWKIRQSPLVTRLWCAPGNPGTANLADNLDIGAEDIAGLVRFAAAEKVDLTVVGPEAPLCAGIVDEFQKHKLLCFGPNKAAAEIEGNKAFARELCRRHRIPGPGFWVFEELAMARSFLDNRPDGPIVVKAAGLAAGKGVTVCKNNEEARAAVGECLEKRRFGEAGSRVVFEEFLEGAEVSLITLTDGRTIVPFDPARDHKAVGDGDKGPNTGGMGVITPVPLMPRMATQIESQIVFPTVHALNRENRRYQGFLYAGLMLTTQGPRVLEYNCRLGDPETQPLLMRLQSDLLPLLLATAEGKLEQQSAPVWDKRVAVCVVACSGGYPGDFKKGVPIFGVDKVTTGPDLQVFHAGTSQRGGDLLTAGGRVLAVTALGVDAAAARQRAYAALDAIEFSGKHYRRDIGLKA